MVIIIFLGLLFACRNSFADEVWQDITGNLDANLYVVAVSPHNENTVYIGSDKAVFKSEDKGKNWQYLYTVKGETQRINFIFFDPKDKNRVYVATGNGLFKTSDNGKTFQRIFREEKEVFYVTKNPEDSIYLGTGNGIFVSEDGGVTWIRLSGIPQYSQIVAIDFHPALPRLIYAVCDSGVYKSFDKGRTWERVFIAQKKEEASYEEEEEISQEEEVSRVLPRCLLINRRNPAIVYLGTTKGLYASRDSGKTWERKTIASLGDLGIRYIVSYDNPDLLYVATARGVFRINLPKLQAEEIYQDLPTHDVRMVALDREHKLWAATDKGLFKTTRISETKMANKDSVLEEYEFYFRNEPAIQEVQAEAIRYAEVHPDKIRRWRAQARLKAFVPEFDLDYDKTISIYGAQNYERVVVGPRDWGMSLKWDLADFIWSTDQTSIDVRSRLMVQLRHLNIILLLI